MNLEVSQLSPQKLWHAFSSINAIPRGSKKEKKIIEFVAHFGKSLGLETEVDSVGNVLIRKPATPGFESSKGVCLQAHLDMVHQKNEDTFFDFDTQGIQMVIDQGWVRAKGTTLGADNGIGAAAILAVLESSDLEHPSIEALFTIDEETGMTGAKCLNPNWLKASYLLNLDTENEDEIDVGCAGGIDITSVTALKRVPLNKGSKAFKVTINGLRGGHSGMDIHRGFANANVLMNEVFKTLNCSINWWLSEIDGGGLRNAIPRECFSVMVIEESEVPQLEKLLKDLHRNFKTHFAATEPHLLLQYHSVDLPESVVSVHDQQRLIEAIEGAKNGVYRWQVSMPDTVETSNNLARVWVNDLEARIECLCRSAVEAQKNDLSLVIKKSMESNGFEVTLSGDYPGWEPKMDSHILEKVVEEYVKCYAKKPQIVSCHAGLECGLLGSHYPQMEMVSFGPNIKGAHSPEECVEIKSVASFWEFLIQVLASLK